MRTALDQLPPDLAAAYDAAFARIRSKRPEAEEFVLNGFAWILYSTRPLQICELQEALSVEMGSNNRDKENIFEFSVLLECFSGLVVVEHESVHFVHYTVQEYFSKRSDLLPPKTHLAKVCLTYALFDDFESGPIDESTPELYDERIQNYPLLEYVAHNWEIYVRGSGEEDPEVLELLQRLLESQAKLNGLLQSVRCEIGDPSTYRWVSSEFNTVTRRSAFRGSPG